MNDKKPIAVEASSLPARFGSGYPDPFDKPCTQRQKKPLGDAFGLSDYGVNLVSLPAGTWSSQRHWHSAEDEFIYILEGRPTLVTDEGETVLKLGCVQDLSQLRVITRIRMRRINAMNDKMVMVTT